MKSAVKVQRVRVQWPDTKGRLRWIWAYRVGDEPPQLTPKLARLEWECKQNAGTSSQPVQDHHVSALKRSPAKVAPIFAAMLMTALDSQDRNP